MGGGNANKTMMKRAKNAEKAAKEAGGKQGAGLKAQVRVFTQAPAKGRRWGTVQCVELQRQGECEHNADSQTGSPVQC